MCGIAGVYGLDNSYKADENILKRMASVMAHRGPDGEGVYVKGNIGLAHRRLSIIDLEGGRQPMPNEDESVWIVFNGEIYNFRELEKELIAKGHKFRTRSDTEAIIHLYEEEGPACVKRMNGMFAFAIWDSRKELLVLARDRIGKKPLHYYIDPEKFIFASEIKAILEETSVKRSVDYKALHDYLTFSYVPAPRTMYRGIFKLPAASTMVVSGHDIRMESYWDPDFSRRAAGSEADICEELYGRLKDATASRLISDVPLGAFLSGGVDSSSIVALMSELKTDPVITNSIGFADKAFDELRYARIVSDKFRTDHHQYTVEPKALDVLDKLVWHYDEPFGDSSMIPTYYVSKMTRQNVTVALSGDGGDENFAGYDRYLYSRNMARLRNMVPGFARDIAGAMSKGLKRYGQGQLSMKFARKLDELYMSPFDIYYKIISTFTEDERGRLYSPKFKRALDGYSPREAYKRIYDHCDTDDIVSKMQYLDMKTYLCDDILVKVDIASMANSLEVRSPILDYKFMEFAASIPSALKIAGVSQKYIFKEAMKDELPQEILDRPKMGFSVPLESWLKTDLRGLVEDNLFDRDGIIGELFDRRYVKRLWDFVLNGRMRGFSAVDIATRVWLLLMFSMWHRRFIANIHSGK